MLFNSAVYLQGGEIRHVHRKLYLPTYGIFQEERFFGEGGRLGLAPLDALGESVRHADLRGLLALRAAAEAGARRRQAAGA